MLTRKDKEEIVTKLSDALKDAPAAVIADFKGVNANDMVALKRELRESGGTFQVIKKTLLSLALKNNKIELDPKSLDGQIAVSISADEVTSAKILDNLGKNNKNIKIVAAVLDGQLLDSADANALAKMPSLDELRGMFVGLLQSPAQSFVGALTSPQKAFAGAMKVHGERAE